MDVLGFRRDPARRIYILKNSFSIKYSSIPFWTEWPIQEVCEHGRCVSVHVEFPARIDSDVAGSRHGWRNVPHQLPTGGFLVHRSFATSYQPVMGFFVVVICRILTRVCINPTGFSEITRYSCFYKQIISTTSQFGRLTYFVLCWLPTSLILGFRNSQIS